jgi:hypothetical protein
MDGLCNTVTPPPIAFDGEHKARCLLYTKAGAEYRAHEASNARREEVTA